MAFSKIFLFILLSFIAGVFGGSFFSIPQLFVWIGAGTCAGLIAIFFRRGSKALNPKIAFYAFLTLFFLFGVLRFNLTFSKQHILEKFALASSQLRGPAAEKYEIKVDVFGYVAEEPEVRGDRQRLIINAKQLYISRKFIDTDERVMITTNLFPAFHFGRQLKLNGELLLPSAFAASDNEEVFDYAAFLAKDRIYTLMSYPDIDETELALPWPEKIKIIVLENIFAFKDRFERSINRSISEPSTSYLKGILLGSRSQMPEEIKEKFARTGTTHILAISGYNITIVASIISGFFLFFFKRQRAFWFSVLGILIFVVLTGAQASVVRAAIMGVLLLFAQKEGRLYGSHNAIILAAAAMILVNPNILRYDIGFQLSFLATMGLIYGVPMLEKYFVKIPNKFQIKKTLLMSISAQILVLPLLIYHFKNLSLVTLPVNLLILPLVPLTMLLGFIMGVAGIIAPVLGQTIGYLTWLISSLQLLVISIFSAPAWAAIQIHLPVYILAVYYLLAFYIIKRAKLRL